MVRNNGTAEKGVEEELPSACIAYLARTRYRGNLCSTSRRPAWLAYCFTPARPQLSSLKVLTLTDQLLAQLRWILVVLTCQQRSTQSQLIVVNVRHISRNPKLGGVSEIIGGPALPLSFISHPSFLSMPLPPSFSPSFSFPSFPLPSSPSLLSCPLPSNFLPFPFLPLLPFPSPFLRSRTHKIQLGAWGSAVSFPNGIGAPWKRIWCVLALKSDIWWQQFQSFSWEPPAAMAIDAIISGGVLPQVGGVGQGV